jgi:hypothetical protein
MAMPIDALVGLTLEQVLAIETKAAAAVTSGGSVVSWSSTGMSVSRLADGTPSEILRACQYAKKVLAPEVYGPLITRTSVSFRNVYREGTEGNAGS